MTSDDIDPIDRGNYDRAAFSYFQDNAINAVFKDASAIVFDLNGLIVDDEPFQLRATNAALAKVGVHFDEETWITRCVGHKPVEYLGHLIFEAIGEMPAAQQIQDLLDCKDEIYRDLMGAEARKIVRAGVTELMTFAKQSGLLIALATSTTRIGVGSVIDDKCLGIETLFDLVICGDDVKRAKPAPEIYETVRQRLGKERHYVVLEDSIIGVRAAKAAKMTCIAVPNRFTANQDFGAADLILDSLEPSTSIRALSTNSYQGRLAEVAKIAD